MIRIDYFVMIAYLIGLLAIGAFFLTRIRSSRDMFAAEGRVPWWMSGLSGFMTIFSAGTFVVWGGIAYEYGMVSVSILVCCGGISTLIVGRVLAARWHRLGVTTPAEYVDLRYGKAAAQAYTWLNVAAGGVSMAIGLFSLSVMLAALIPLPAGNFLANPDTGTLAVEWAILIGGTVVVAYTMLGGLWAVLTTDVIQCVVLSLVVLMVVPLSLGKIGGWSEFVARAPESFFRPTAGEFGWVFLVFWTLINTFLYGGHWAFIQRYICVPTGRDARKAAYLMGVLYLVSPLLWMLPAMVYRVMQPEADPRQAYILVCQEVLPAGMLGMTLAAMFSATASMVSSLLNVFAGAFTRDIYRPLFRPNASERHLMIVGRLSTLVYGVAVIVLALLIPFLGGVKEVVFGLVMLVFGPTVVPMVWGVFSRRVNQAGLWITVLGAALITGVVKFGLPAVLPQSSLVAWTAEHGRLTDSLLGSVVPILLMLTTELWSRGTSPGWQRLSEHAARHEKAALAASASLLPAVIVACTMWILAALILVLGFLADEQAGLLFLFAALLSATGAVVVWFARRHG